MKTKREIVNEELRVLNARLRLRGRQSMINFKRYLEIKSIMLNLTDRVIDLCSIKPRYLVNEFLYMESTVNDFKTAVVSRCSEHEIRFLGEWLKIAANEIEKHRFPSMHLTELEKLANAIIEDRNREKEKEKENNRKWYSVKEFATLVNLHPHTIRKYYKSGKLNGRQDTKGIFIDANELKKYI